MENEELKDQVAAVAEEEVAESAADAAEAEEKKEATEKVAMTKQEKKLALKKAKSAQEKLLNQRLGKVFNNQLNRDLSYTYSFCYSEALTWFILAILPELLSVIFYPVISEPPSSSPNVVGYLGAMLMFDLFLQTIFWPLKAIAVILLIKAYDKYRLLQEGALISENTTWIERAKHKLLAIKIALISVGGVCVLHLIILFSEVDGLDNVLGFLIAFLEYSSIFVKFLF